jgi:hypothetical protein
MAGRITDTNDILGRITYDILGLLYLGDHLLQGVKILQLFPLK